MATQFDFEPLNLSYVPPTSPATGQLGLRQPTRRERLGGTVQSNLIRMGGIDPSTLRTTAERRAARNIGLRTLADRLRSISAGISGDPARMQLELERQRQRQATVKDTRPTSVREYEYSDPTPTPEEYAEFLQQKRTQTQRQETDPFRDMVAKQYEEKQAAGVTASETLTKLNQLDTLLDAGVNTGFGEGFKQTASELGGFIFGEELAGKDITQKQTFKALTNSLVAPLIKNLGQNPTDRDLQFVVDTAPGLEKTEKANKILIEVLKLSSNRALDEATFDRQFWSNPNNRFANQVQRDIAFQEHKQNRPELYDITNLKSAYFNLLKEQGAATGTEEGFVAEEEDLPPAFQQPTG